MKAKILLQLLWSVKVGWDDPVPDSLLEEWLQWRSGLHLLSSHHKPRCHYPKGATLTSMQLHGFSDASEKAYSGVVYLRMEDSIGTVHTSVVMAKSHVAPIKRQGCKEVHITSRCSSEIEWLRSWSSSRPIAGDMLPVKTIQLTVPCVESTLPRF